MQHFAEHDLAKTLVLGDVGRNLGADDFVDFFGAVELVFLGERDEDMSVWQTPLLELGSADHGNCATQNVVDDNVCDQLHEFELEHSRDNVAARKPVFAIVVKRSSVTTSVNLVGV